MNDAPPISRKQRSVFIYLVESADAVGLGMYLSLSVIFLVSAVDLSNREVGLVLGASGVASLLGAVPIARAAERIGLRRSLTVLFLVRAASFAALANVSTFGAVLGVSLVAGLLSRGIGPLIESSMLSLQRGDEADSVNSLARLRTLRNAGMALGALPAGWAIAVDSRGAFQLILALASGLFLISAVLCQGFPTGRPGASKDDDSSLPPIEVTRNIPFLWVTVLFSALALSGLLFAIGLPLWIVQETDAPRWSVTVCQLLNTILVVLLQVRVSRGSEKPERAKLLMLFGGVLSACGSLVVVLAGRFEAGPALAVVVLSAVLFTLAELAIVVGCTGAALLHIPVNRRTEYLAAFNVGFGVATVIGPIVISSAIMWGAWSWVAWAAFFALVGLASLGVPTAPKNNDDTAIVPTASGEQR